MLHNENRVVNVYDEINEESIEQQTLGQQFVQHEQVYVELEQPIKLVNDQNIIARNVKCLKKLLLSIFIVLLIILFAANILFSKILNEKQSKLNQNNISILL